MQFVQKMNLDILRNQLLSKVESIRTDKVREYSHLLTIELADGIASTNIALYWKHDHSAIPHDNHFEHRCELMFC